MTDTPVDKPAAVYDREHEWSDLIRFVTDPGPGLRIGVVRGRRRHGKSYLLEHLCRTVGGVYTLALRQSRRQALDRFSHELSDALEFTLGRFDSWVSALDAAVDALTSAAGERTPVLVLDEFPYLVAHSPELPSAIQALYDRRGPASGEPPFRLVLCGSALSVMSTVLAGDQALRGRAMLDLRVGPFRYRDAAGYWDCEPETALLVDAVLGGAPGYRDVVGAAPEPGPAGFSTWLAHTLLNPSHILFNEPDYLLAEDPRISDRAIYHAIWETVAAGATTPTRIGGDVGMDAKSLGYHLTIMKEAGFLRYEQDLLRQRHPVISVADPVVRFHQLVVRPHLAELELREAEPVWQRSQEVFAARVLGPHVETLTREWVRWYGREAGLDVGPVGTTVVACRAHGSHEVDVVGLSRGSIPRTKRAQITLLGEAKATGKPRERADLRRLAHVRDLLVSAGWDAAGARLLLASRTGFDADLTARESAARESAVQPAAGGVGAVLLDLPALYGHGPVRIAAE